MGNVGSYNAGTRHFDVIFFYSAGGLYDVTLTFRNRMGCRELKEDLIGVYGDPIKKIELFPFLSFYDWRDEEKNNSITLSDLGQECTIMYRPLRAVGL